VKRVIYPALEGNPGHAIWKRDFSGAASLFSFVLRPASEGQVTSFLDTLKLFGIGSSWGGFESLAIAAHKEILRIRTATRWDADEPVIRLHIGLEDPDDLIADLERGFAAMQKA
jgi:cystathionine beta-lyase